MKLILRDISKTYQDRVIGVDKVDLNVAENEMAVLLGPSGCGKTTLLRLICGLENPDSGSILLDGQDITGWEPRRRDIAMVFQNYALYPHMSVRKNLEFGLRARKTPKAELNDPVDWAAGLLELREVLDRKPKELSGGQRQRVALGRAIVRRPRLYLYDEPLSNLDAKLRVRMRGEILALHRRVAGTSIYVTHDQVEAMSLADRIFVMNKGRIVAWGSPAELYDDPPDLFTAGFLGFPAMNLIEGRLANGEFLSRKGLRLPAREDRSGPATLGIRPEEIKINKSGSVEGVVKSLENLGRTILLFITTTGGDEFGIVADGEHRIGERISADFNPGKVIFFDPDSKRRIRGTT